MADQTTTTPSTSQTSSPEHSSSTTSSSSTTEMPKPSTTANVPQSCTKAFDSLYYCYSPVFQARQYYMNGELDSCRGRLRRFRLCLLSRLKPHSQAEQLFLEEEQRAKKEASIEHVQPVWEMREDYLANVERANQTDDQDELIPPKEKNSWWL